MLFKLKKSTKKFSSEVKDSKPFDQTELTKSLANTKKWCGSLIDLTSPETCFRTQLLEKNIANSQGSQFNRMSFWPRPEEVDQTIIVKSEALEKYSSECVSLNTGRLLLSIPDWSNFSGLSYQESSGYLDDHDTPPWDTWLGQITINESEFLLLSWVPDEFIECVEFGIQAECIGMLHWANAKYWGEYTTPNQAFLNCIPQWVFEHESAKI